MGAMKFSPTELPFIDVVCADGLTIITGQETLNGLEASPIRVRDTKKPFKYIVLDDTVADSGKLLRAIGFIVSYLSAISGTRAELSNFFFNKKI
jgi:hypothetical protein